MAAFDYDIGIIGGGAAGLTVASGASQLGAKTLLIEKEPRLGGDCLHYGCVPSKTLIRSAHVYHLMQRAPDFGLPAVSLPPVAFKQIRRRIRSVINKIQMHDSKERFCSLGANVVFGPAAFADEYTVVVDGKRHSAAKWVIATGSSAAIPPVPGLDRTAYLTNKEIFYMDHLPPSMVILGAGPIGIEMAQAFARLGTQVTVVDKADQVLIKEDKDMADAVMGQLQSEGVRFNLGCSLSSVAEDTGGKKKITLTDGQGEPHILTTDSLLVAAGRRANTDNLNLEAAGIAASRQGIKVDKRLRTSRKHIYAAGDVISGYQFTHAAGYEGGIVVSNAIFHLPRKVDYTFMPWATYTDPELASIGMNEKTARQAGIETRVWTEAFKDNDRILAEGRQAGRIKLLVDTKDKPVGVQILGPRAGDLIGEWVAALNGNVKLSKIAASVHPYPTTVEINKKVAGALFAPKLFSEKVQKGLKFFFNLKGRACTPDEDTSKTQ